MVMLRRRLPVFCWMFVMLIMGIADVAAQPVAGKFGVGLTPAHFPRQTGDDVASMYQEAARLGGVAILNFRWDDTTLGRVSEQMLQLAEQYGVQPVIQLDVLQQGGFAMAPPAGAGQQFDQAFVDAYAATVRRFAQQQPPYLAVATDINRLLGVGPERLVQFAQVYKRIYAMVKQISPNTKVFVTFNWDIFANAAEQHHVPVSALKQFVDLFRPQLDVLAMSSVPTERFSSANAVPDRYYQAIGEMRGSEPVLLIAGWPSAMGGDAAQAAFVDRMPAMLGSLRPAMLLWPILHDISVGPSVAASLGLYTSDGRAKPAAARFQALEPARGTANVAAPAAAMPAPGTSSEVQRRDPADKFAIYSSTLSGTDRVLLLSDPRREINHARVSPDGTRFVFTRYNRRNQEGDATEETSYLQTEIDICRIDGGGCSVAIPPRAGIVAANANWSPDGKQLMFVTNDRPSHRPGISFVDLATGAVRAMPMPEGIALADPNEVPGVMVAAGTPTSGLRLSRIYQVDPSTGAGRPLCTPEVANLREMDPPLGDHDPKLSPDGRLVAAMRHFDKDDWGIVTISVASGEQRSLSGPHPVDAVPEWSGDGKLLLFWHVERGDLMRSGLYTMRPDGSNRQRIPLPHGYFYTMPAFFPGQGSGPGARIIYSTKAEPRM